MSNKKQSMKLGNHINDRIGEFLVGHLDSYIFDELSDDFLKKNGFFEILSGVPVPVRKDDMVNLSIKKICINMAFVIGCDANFRYRDNYIEFIKLNYGLDFGMYLVQEGVDVAEKNDFDYACIMFRAAFLINPENVDAIYCYGRACADAYQKGGSEAFVGAFKAEAIEAFEKTTLKRPDFKEGFYYLGYAYMNLGLYIKAKLTFEEFKTLAEKELAELSNSDEPGAETKEDLMSVIKEADDWISQLEEPVKIEEGYNMVMSGRYSEGIEILSQYTGREEYKTFWPMWYYLGVAYKEIDMQDMAEAAFISVLRVSPSNLYAMEELVHLYKSQGRSDMAEKYENKMALVQENIEKDRSDAKEMKSQDKNTLS